MRSDEIKTVAFRLLGCSKLSIHIAPAPRTERGLGQLELCPHLVEVNGCRRPQLFCRHLDTFLEQTTGYSV